MKPRSSFLTAVGAIPSICVAQGPTLSEEMHKLFEERDGAESEIASPEARMEFAHREIKATLEESKGKPVLYLGHSSDGKIQFFLISLEAPIAQERMKKDSTSIKVIPMTFTEFVDLGIEPFMHKPKRFKIDSAIVTEALKEFRGAFKVLQAPREVLTICKVPSDAFNPVLFEKKPPVHKRQPFNPTLKSQKRNKGSFGGSHLKPGGSRYVSRHG